MIAPSLTNPSDALAWAVDLRTGKPTPEAPVEIHDESRAIIPESQNGLEDVFDAPVSILKDPFSASYAITYPQVYDDLIAWAASYLPAGTYTLTYNLAMLQAGDYRVLPAHARLFYFPDVQGVSAGTVFEIKPGSLRC